MTTTDTLPVFNPLLPGFPQDPYPHYAELLARNPVGRTVFGGWALARYDDCFRLLRDPELSVDPEVAQAEEGRFPDLVTEAAEETGIEVGTRSILDMDPPDHTRLRKLVSRVFTPRAIESWRDRVRELVGEALDAAEPGQPWDLIANLAFPLPFQVISEMLGMPESDRDQIRSWTHDMTLSLDPIVDPDLARRIVASGGAFRSYLTEVIAWKRQHPGDDLLSAMIQAEEDGDVLSDDELRSQTTLLFIAGHETTVNLIGNGILALARHPDQRRRLADDASLVANAVDELLRFDPPVQFTRRITRQDWELDGVTIPAGHFVVALTAGANRDPSQWGDDGDALDLGREGAAKHLSFGSGIHHCLGAALARMEGQEAIGGLVSRFPDFELAGEPERNDRIVLRGLEALPLELRR